MPVTCTLNSEAINALDLSAIQALIEQLLKESDITCSEQQLQFQIDYELEPGDPRELPEIPEIRLWFIRLDSRYPWIPFLLDWKSGELVRYAAMLVPHQFSTQDGIQFNPEALEIFVMHKVFVLTDWLRSRGLESRSRLKAMAQMFGYDLEDDLFDLLSRS
ncbi:hypothetical protein BST81_20200 [Leptolyngbya sp. 'hensonii']|uniref:CRR6 family NdhI maturation factor n=1 Tax=Leptolyngbya sp. 'hensonii' TaxID=1922337 RepID=UPI000950230E|nr:CRR6 family NdhI maturation factor [Leptolyngbya sp. 'hensonii']OLP16525.1 hypothetical protein BST81_20200 [Leptolyngbya sp. 'hensonii']